jgi:LL-diaminopimelate aminotransferase
MTENFSYKPADRIASFKPYFFADLGKRIAVLKSKGVDVISLDMGSPDLPPADFIIDTLVQQARRDDTHRYTPYGGTTAYRKAIAEYYYNRFRVELDPTQELLGLLGSKEGLFHLSQVMLNPGDLSIIPDPGYPTYASGALMAGAEIYPLPLVEENSYLPDLDAIPTEIRKRAKLLWLNYPNNPTGAVAPISFFEKAVEFAHTNHILLAHDAPYTDVCFGDYKAPSLLQVDGAKEVAVEFNSLSKAYNMGGWRLGMVVGNPQVIGYMHTYKTQVDTSHFQPMLDAGITALTGDQSWIVDRNQVYQERRDIVVEGLRNAGFKAPAPAATIYVWAKLPQQYPDSVQYCNRLLEETGVSTTPGAVYGSNGEGYIRLSLGIPADRIREAMNRIIDWTRIKT